MLALTFDADWVPQAAVELALAEVRKRGLKATLFATSPHAYPEEDWLEVALHPNFKPGSTQGGSPGEVMHRLKEWHPTARGVRVHGLGWRAEYASLMLAHGVRYDSSLYSGQQPGLAPFGQDGLVRLPIFWSDNRHLQQGLPLQEVCIPYLEGPGLRVLLFHPIHIIWNTPSQAHYEANKAACAALDEQGLEDLLARRHNGPGLGTFFRLLLDHIIANGWSTHLLGDIASALEEH